MFLLLLAVRSVLQSRSLCKRWDMETIEWGRPRPSLLQRWRTKMGRIRFRLPGFAKQRMSEIAPKPTPSASAIAPADPHSITCTQHRPLDDRVDLKFPGDLAQRFANSLVHHYGSAGNHS